MRPTEPMRRILIVGATGQLGTALQRSLLYLGTVFSASRTDKMLPIDLEAGESIERAVARTHPTHIVNAAAYTRVDDAENDERRCELVNADGVGTLARCADRIGASLIHISTDYVFDGMKRSDYRESDEANPLNVYGRSKLRGEQLALQGDHNALVLRTSWLYSQEGVCFPNTMRRLLTTKDRIQVVADQVGSPTHAADLADAIATLIPRWEAQGPNRYRGVLHAAGATRCSWFDWSTALARKLGATCTVEPVSTEDWGAPAPRPLYSPLDSNELLQQFGIEIPGWKQGLGAQYRAS